MGTALLTGFSTLRKNRVTKKESERVVQGTGRYKTEQQNVLISYICVNVCGVLLHVLFP